MKIDIILATYNGARFIRTQICSVLSQTYPHWRLLIHDDGSTDDTVRIVKEMAASDTRIQRCKRTGTWRQLHASAPLF